MATFTSSVGDLEGWHVNATASPNSKTGGAQWSFVACSKDGKGMVGARAARSIADRDIAFESVKPELRMLIEEAERPDPDRCWWWGGHFDDVDDGTYTHGECATREGVITALLNDFEEGEKIVVAEAQFGFGEPRFDGVVPFRAIRNKEFLIIADGKAVAAPAEEETPER